MNPRPLGPEPRRGKTNLARTFLSESTLPWCLPLLFPKKRCALFGEPSIMSALGGGTREVVYSGLIATNKTPTEENLCGCFGRGDGICAFGGAPRCTAHRADAVCVPAIQRFSPHANRLLAQTPPPSNPVGYVYPYQKKGTGKSAVPIGNIIKYKQELHFQAMRKELRNFYRSSFSILS